MKQFAILLFSFASCVAMAQPNNPLKENARKFELDRLDAEMKKLDNQLLELSKVSACRTASDCVEIAMGQIGECGSVQVPINKANLAEARENQTQKSELGRKAYLTKFERHYDILSASRCGLKEDKMTIGCLKEKSSPSGFCRLGNDPNVSQANYEFLMLPVKMDPPGPPPRMFKSVMDSHVKEKNELNDQETAK